jgi:alpha-mannosidase
MGNEIDINGGLDFSFYYHSHGDGGGGPTPEMLERLKRMKNVVRCHTYKYLL